MTMLAGTVTVASDLTASGTGLALDLYTEIKTGLYDASGTDTAKKAFLDSIAMLSAKLATAIVTHITTHAVVVPLLLVAPPGGGPVTGTGTVT